MDHGTFRELAAGAALDDLDAAERAALDDHLAGCASCRGDARSLADTAGLLAFAVPQLRAPAALRGDVLAAIAASEGRPVGVPPASLAYAGASRPAAGPVGSGPVAEASRGSAGAGIVDLETLRRERTRYRRLSFTGLAAAAALAVAVGGLGATVLGLEGRIDAAARERDAAVAARDAVVAARDAAVARLAAVDAAMGVVVAPDHATAALTPEPIAGQASVYVVYRPGTTEAWLMAGNLPALPAGKVYQLWSADAAGVHGLATFTCDATGPCLAPFGVDLGGATATMITLEPAGGAVGEPGPQVAFGELEG